MPFPPKRKRQLLGSGGRGLRGLNAILNEDPNASKADLAFDPFRGLLGLSYAV